MSTLTASEINDALDVAECAIHDKVADPNEREWLHGIIRKLRAGALNAVASETQPQLTKGEIEALIDHHDFNESGADAMGIDGSAEYHRKRRAEFTALREKMK